MDLIPMPAALLSCLLLPLRGQESRQKQVGIGHRGRSAEKYILGSHDFRGILTS
jgi:hypothetical protein